VVLVALMLAMAAATGAIQLLVPAEVEAPGDMLVMEALKLAEAAVVALTMVILAEVAAAAALAYSGRAQAALMVMRSAITS